MPLGKPMHHPAPSYQPTPSAQPVLSDQPVPSVMSRPGATNSSEYVTDADSTSRNEGINEMSRLLLQGWIMRKLFCLYQGKHVVELLSCGFGMHPETLLTNKILSFRILLIG